MCATCCLRLRICYSDQKCPLCKQVNKEVVVLQWPGAVGVPRFSELQQRREWLREQPEQWGRGVRVYADPGRSAASRLPAHLTAVSAI